MFFTLGSVLVNILLFLVFAPLYVGMKRTYEAKIAQLNEEVRGLNYELAYVERKLQAAEQKVQENQQDSSKAL